MNFDLPEQKSQHLICSPKKEKKHEVCSTKTTKFSHREVDGLKSTNSLKKIL